jgi:hypothetical protein
LALGWALFALQTLTNCSGSTEHGGSPTGGSAGTNAGKGGSDSATTGTGGNSSEDGGTQHGGAASGYGGYSGGGTASGAGMSGYVGFGGHTSGCFMNPCQPGCGVPNASCGGTSNGGTTSTPGEAGSDAGGDAGAAGAAPAKRVAPPPLAPARSSVRACYPLSGFEIAACLPADDALLAWLTPLPNDCTLTVLDGPEPGLSAAGRACCYTVACGDSAE